MSTLRWPPLLKTESLVFAPSLQSKSGGITTTGNEQVVVSSAGRWVASAVFFVGHYIGGTRAQDSVILWRAMLARLQGRSNPVLFGPSDSGNTPASVAGTSYGGQTTFDDGATFDDGTEFDQAQTPALVVGNQPNGSTSVVVDMLAGHSPEPGQYFSVSERMFLINTAELSDDQMTGEVSRRWNLTFWPPVREPLIDGTVAEFDDPVCKMRFAADNTAALQMKALYQSSPSADFVEYPA